MKKSRITASIFAAITAFCPQAYAKPEFTTQKFLNWERPAQNSFFQISVTMAGAIAAQVIRETAGCIDKWYFPDETNKVEKMLLAMKKYPDYHPSAVVLAFIEKACGKIKE